MKYRIFLLVIFLAIPWGGAYASTPEEVIKNTLDEFDTVIEQRRDEFAKHPEQLKQLVYDLFLPRFDTNYAAQLMLGKYSRSATPEQRKRFIAAFYQFLTNSYAQGFLDYDRDRIRVIPSRGPVPDRRASVRTEVRLDDGVVVPVDYSLHNTADGWKVYDVVIEGVSYVRNQRAIVAERISDVGMDAFLDEIEKEAERAGGSDHES